jgi:integrase
MQSWRSAIEALPDDGVRDIFLTLAYTGLRRDEWRLACWRNIDLKRGTIHLPDPKNRKPVTLPLCMQVREILERRARLFGSEPDGLVFTRRGVVIGEFILFKASVVTSKAVGHDWCAHDLRRVFVTVADQLVGATIAKRLVHHADRDVHSGYFVLDVERLRRYGQHVADHIFKSAVEIIDFNVRRAGVV